MRKTPPANPPKGIKPPVSGGKYRARVWPKVRYAWNPCKSMVLTRAVTPSSLELYQEIGNVIGVLNRMLKSYALCVYFQK